MTIRIKHVDEKELSSQLDKERRIKTEYIRLKKFPKLYIDFRSPLKENINEIVDHIDQEEHTVQCQSLSTSPISKSWVLDLIKTDIENDLITDTRPSYDGQSATVGSLTFSKWYTEPYRRASLLKSKETEGPKLESQNLSPNHNNFESVKIKSPRVYDRSYFL
jgi:hypothetical protein